MLKKFEPIGTFIAVPALMIDRNQRYRNTKKTFNTIYKIQCKYPINEKYDMKK
jgi:hypothetical protein